MRPRVLLAPLVVFTVAALTAPAVAAEARHPSTPKPIAFSYLGETELPNALQFDGTTVGGLSAISWDARTGRYLLISDDRSQTDPARFYTAAISAGRGTVSVRLLSTDTLKQADGTAFRPTSADGSVIAPDPEGIAVDPRHRRFAWSSEGERVLSPLTLGDPAVRLAAQDGTTVQTLPSAPQLHMNAQEVGPRRNQTLEGLSYTPSGDRLWAAMEDPLYQDGQDPTADHGAQVRVTGYDAASGLPASQYAYPLSKLFEPGAADATNGLSDIAALGGSRFLTIERAFTTRNTIRIFEADASRATDVLARDALGSAPVTPMRKRLVVDLDTVKGLPHIDNVEGITIGPKLPDGRRLVLLVSDDNFSASQVTQVIAFAATGI